MGCAGADTTKDDVTERQKVVSPKRRIFANLVQEKYVVAKSMFDCMVDATV